MPLRGVLKTSDTTSRIIRLEQKLADLDYEIIYKKGKENKCADFLSRNPCEVNNRKPGSSENNNAQLYSTLLTIKEEAEVDEVRQEEKPYIVDYPNDEEWKEYSYWEGERTNVPGKLQSSPLVVLIVTRAQAQRLNSTMELRTKKLKPAENSGKINNDKQQNSDDWEDLSDEEEVWDQGIENIVKPKERKIILKDYHDSIFGGHFGSAKTYAKIKRKFYWKGMKKDIEDYVKQCKKCQRNKTGRSTKMPVTFTTLSQKPFDKLYIDLVGPLPMSLSGNKYILSMVDDLTRFVEFVAIPDQTAQTVARALYEEILCRYTLPKVIVSDNGGCFIADIFKQTCRLLGISNKQITPYAPMGNLVERQHSTLANYLRCFVSDKPTEWDTYLRTAAHAYNNTPHMSTTLTPMETLFGWTSEIPSNLKRKPQPIYNAQLYHQQLRHQLQTSFKYVRSKLSEAKVTSNINYNKHLNERSFKVGQKVLIRSTRRSSKLSEHWKGPYVILELHENKVNATIKMEKSNKKVHLNRLKPYFELKINYIVDNLANTIK